MCPEIRTVRSSSPGRQFLTLVPLILCCLVGFLSTRSVCIGSVVGSGAYLIYRIVFVRWIIKRAHLRGIRDNLQGNCAAAIDAFIKSERFWGNHPRLDRYRAILLGEASLYSFYDMARFNRAICLIHLSRAPEASAILDELLKDNPTTIGDGKFTGPAPQSSSSA
jgi:hypothetical protein